MRILLFFVFIFYVNYSVAQIEKLDTFLVTSNTKVAGICYFPENPYSKYSFLLEDSATIKKFIDHLHFGNKAYNYVNRYSLELTFIKNNDFVFRISIYPELNIASIDGISYIFNFDQLSWIHNDYPLNLKIRHINFRNMTEYNQYLLKKDNNTNLILHGPPNFKYEGGFEIKIGVSKSIPHPKAANDSISKVIKIAYPTQNYQVGFSTLRNDIKQGTASLKYYIISIDGSKEMYNTLAKCGFDVRNWKKYETQSASFYYK